MKPITRTELAAHSLAELHGLLRQVFNALAVSAPASGQHSDALASLKTIRAEIASRDPAP
ncbi:MAG: hypothetical protein CL807_09365 [Citromicrobium sp.]|nr:hypothetical protein [Citromicrobium sp.]MAO97354.1 hypothetical protein [Citromicrobium sp.]MBD77072.1 hypothetical protein [Citromicrobium sp.]MBT48472.1 hypothetical protein [Citromicrobium sp.]|tara:strand:- start:175 stop:354 length:180 start_codon:yes stop_codon:yes gene_type:complete